MKTAKGELSSLKGPSSFSDRWLGWSSQTKQQVQTSSSCLLLIIIIILDGETSYSRGIGQVPKGRASES